MLTSDDVPCCFVLAEFGRELTFSLFRRVFTSSLLVLPPPFFHRAAITPKTKVIILNTPHNPVGKVFTRNELEQFAKVAIDNNLLVLSDEVVSFSSLPFLLGK